MTKRRLGRGLKQLIPASEQANSNDVEEIALQEIVPNPFQPRKTFDQEKLEQLASSIKRHGVLEPIIVRKTESRYQIVVGERRWRASQLAGLETIPALVKEWDDRRMMQIALIENLQRENLNIIEEAEGYQRLIDEFSLTQDEVAHSVGKKRSSVANALRLLKLDEITRGLVSSGQLSQGHAKVLLGVENKDLRGRLARRVVEEDLSVRQLEKLLKNNKSVPRGTRVSGDPEIQSLQEELQRALGTKVKINYRSGKGKIEIQYYSDEEFERILDLFRD